MTACRLIVLLAINLVPVGRRPKEAKVIGGTGGCIVVVFFVCDFWPDLGRQRKREKQNGNNGWRKGEGCCFVRGRGRVGRGGQTANAGLVEDQEALTK